MRPNLPDILKERVELHGKEVGVIAVQLVERRLPVEIVVAHADIRRIVCLVHHPVATRVAARAEDAHCSRHVLVQIVVMGKIIAKQNDLSRGVCPIAQRPVSWIDLPHQLGDALVEHARIAGRGIAASIWEDVSKRREHVGLGDGKRLVEAVGETAGRVILHRAAVWVLIAKGIIRPWIIAMGDDGKARVQPITCERLDCVSRHCFDAGQKLAHALRTVEGEDNVRRAVFGRQERDLALADRLPGRQGCREPGRRQRRRSGDGLGDAHVYGSRKRFSSCAQKRLGIPALRTEIGHSHFADARCVLWGNPNLSQAAGVSDR